VIEYVILEGEELSDFLDYMRRITRDGTVDGVYRVRVAIENGVKVKVNEHTWSPPMGAVVPMNR
jgi:hypothetical protein